MFILDFKYLNINNNDILHIFSKQYVVYMYSENSTKVK